ncbi:MAG: helix-turn-helix transcriptional regulator [Clostridiales bacterium]|nr:helix-turn-helix transcriptional regulator [Clostridiales bacterium]
MSTQEQIDRIKLLAKDKGIKIKYICSQLGLSETYLANVRNGRDRMTSERLEKIAKILETTPEYLKGETDNPDIPKEPAAIFEDERQAELNAIFERMPDETSKDKLLQLVRSFEITNKYEIGHRYIGGIAAKGGNKPIVHRIPSESGRPQNDDALLRGGAAAFGGDSATIELDEKDLEEYHKMHSINYQEDTSEK